MVKSQCDFPVRKGYLLYQGVAIALLCAAGGTYAQELEVTDASEAGVPPPGITVVPRVSMTQSFTDNVNQTTSGRQAEQITEVSPGIRVVSTAGRVKGHLDYALRAIAYANTDRADSFQNALDTVGTYEVVDRLLFLDFSGNISQQAIHALGTQSGPESYNTTNRAEVSNYRLSPYLQGHLGRQANYVLRVTRQVTQSDSAAAPGTATLQSTANFDGATPLKNLGWLVEVSRVGVDYSAGRYTESDLSDAGLSYALTPQFSVFAKAGIESNNYTSLDKRSYSSNDIGLKWIPSQHMRVLASRGNRSFGDTHAVSIEYGTALVVLRFSDTRDVSAVPTAASLVPSVVGGFVVSALSVQRKQDLELVLRGVRGTLRFIASQSESTRVDTVSTAFDDLARAPVNQVGARLSYLHRLSPGFNLGLATAIQRASGAPGLPDNWLREVGMSLTGKITRRSTLGVGLRHSDFTGATPYEENAVSFNLTFEF